MAKKNKITLENVSLKPQSLGKVYKKKNNIVRVIIIFIAFIVIIYYINDISLFINNLLGKKSATSIIDNQEKNKKNDNKNNNEFQEVVFNVYQEDLKIEYDNLKLTNFKLNNNILSFIIINTSSNNLSLKDNNYYFEFYNENKTLLKRTKVDINNINSNASINETININDNFYYITFSEKSEEYYPNVTINNNKLICVKENDTIEYYFIDNKLDNIKHIIAKNKDSINYEESFKETQEYVNKYNTYNGISGSLNNDDNGYNAIIMVNLKNIVDEINKYYFKNSELAKVVNFEMEAYGFDCN